jgi:hypothetical protein
VRAWLAFVARLAEEAARLLASSVQIRARLNVTGVPLCELLARRTAVGVTPGGAIVLPGPIDYISWTEQIACIAAQKDLRAPRRGVWLTGRMSARAQYGLSEFGWAVHDAPLLLVGAR